MIKFEVLGFEICIGRRLLILVFSIIGIGLSISGYYIYSNKIQIIDTVNKNSEAAIGGQMSEEGKSKYDSKGDIIGGTEIREIKNSDKNSLTITEIQDEIDLIQVYVVGCVKHSGTILKLKKGTIVADAIELAGGFTEDADVENINMVYQLWENTTIKIFSKRISPVESDTVSDASDAYKNNLLKSKDTGMRLINEFTDELGGGELITSVSPLNKAKRIDINKATKEELMQLTGIGEKTASAIIDYRKDIGNYKSIEELMNVKNIGEKTFENLKEEICIN